MTMVRITSSAQRQAQVKETQALKKVEGRTAFRIHLLKREKRLKEIEKIKKRNNKISKKVLEAQKKWEDETKDEKKRKKLKTKLDKLAEKSSETLKKLEAKTAENNEKNARNFTEITNAMEKYGFSLLTNAEKRLRKSISKNEAGLLYTTTGLTFDEESKAVKTVKTPKPELFDVPREFPEEEEPISDVEEPVNIRLTSEEIDERRVERSQFFYEKIIEVINNNNKNIDIFAEKISHYVLVVTFMLKDGSIATNRIKIFDIEDTENIKAILKGDALHILSSDYKFSSEYAISLEGYPINVDIITFYDKALGAYHFTCEDFEGVTFDYKDVATMKEKPIFTSTLKNNDCIFYVVLRGIKLYLKVEIDEKEINNFRRDKLLNAKKKCNYEAGYQFFNYLYNKHSFKVDDVDIKTLSFIGSGCSKVDKTRNRLQICVYQHHNHLFMANSKHHDRVKQIFVPTETYEASLVEQDIDYVELANQTEKKCKSSENGKVGTPFLYFSFDIESHNALVEEFDRKTCSFKEVARQQPTHLGVIPFGRLVENGDIQVGTFSCFRSMEKLEEFIMQTVKNFTKKREGVNQAQLLNNIYLGAWNAQNYDFPILKFSHDIISLQGAEKRLPVYKFGNFQVKCRDTMRTVLGQGTLKGACASFKVANAKMSVDPEYFFKCLDAWSEGLLNSPGHITWTPDEEIKNHCIKNKVNYNNFEDVLIEYLRLDCLSQAEVLIKYCEQCEENFEVFPLGKTSSAGISGFLLNNAVKTKVDIFQSTTLDKYFKKAMIGGRTLMLASYYNANIEMETSTWNEQLKDLVTYVDAVSLYPSAMTIFKYPTKFIEAIPGAPENLLNIINLADTEYVQEQNPEMTTAQVFESCLRHIDDILINSEETYICEAIIRNPVGLITAASKRKNDGLRHGHYKENKSVFTLSALLRAKYLNNADIEIISTFSFKAGNIFEFVKDLFNLRLEAKNRGDDVASLLYKLIMNSIYGKCCEGIFDEQIVSPSTYVRRHKGKAVTDVIEYNENTLFEVRTTDSSGKLFHIAAFILDNSKWLMDRVIDTLGGTPGNFRGFEEKTDDLQVFIEEKWYFPIFNTDTDSMGVRQRHFESSTEFLQNTAIDPNTNAMGGFHIDVEAPGDADNNYQPIIVEAVWLSAKTYALGCKYVDKKGEIKTFHHLRAKGIPKKWIENYTCSNYLELSTMPEGTSKVIQYNINKRGEEPGTHWRFQVNRQSGEITKDYGFDRTFPRYDGLKKHRKFSEEQYLEQRRTGIPLVYPAADEE